MPTPLSQLARLSVAGSQPRETTPISRLGLSEDNLLKAHT